MAGQAYNATQADLPETPLTKFLLKEPAPFTPELATNLVQDERATYLEMIQSELTKLEDASAKQKAELEKQQMLNQYRIDTMSRMLNYKDGGGVKKEAANQGAKDEMQLEGGDD